MIGCAKREASFVRSLKPISTTFSVGALAFALLAAPLTGPAQAQQGPTRVLVSAVETREIRDEAPIIGALVATVDSAVATRVSGVVRETSFKVGDIVEKGAVIARIDSESYEIEHDVAQASIEQAEAGLAVAAAKRARAEDELKRAEGLRGSAAYSPARVEDLGHAAVEAASAETQAKAQLASAKAALARADYALRWTDIRAPFSGVVTERVAQPGQYIAVGAAAARLVNLGELEVEIDAPVDRISALPLDAPVTVQIGSTSAKGSVRAIIPREAAATRTRPIRISVDFEGVDPALLSPGAVVTVLAPTQAPRQALVAPKDSLVQGPGGWMVYVAADGQAQPRPVVIGASSGDRVEIVKGVAPGDLVVVRGNEGLRPNQPIAPVLEGEAKDGQQPAKGDRS